MASQLCLYFTKLSEYFTGIGLYVFFIVPDSPNGTATVDTDLVFTLDSEPAGTYSHSVTSQQAFLYNVPVYANSNINSGDHVFIMTLTAPSGASSVALFDYLVYTCVFISSFVLSECQLSFTRVDRSNDSTSVSSNLSTAGSTSTMNPTTSASGSSSILSASTSTATASDGSSHTGAIAGGVVGGLVILTLLGFLSWCVFIKRRRKTKEPNSPVLPEMSAEEDFLARPAVFG